MLALGHRSSRHWLAKRPSAIGADKRPCGPPTRAAKHAFFFLPHLGPGMDVLDCGCGSGGITLDLAQAIRPGSVIGIDVAEVEIERARLRAKQGSTSNVHFEIGDIRALPFPDRSFDAASAHNVLEHVTERPDAFSAIAHGEAVGRKP